MTTTPGPHLDASFATNLATRTPRPLRHGADGHPLLSIDAIADLAARMRPESISSETPDKELVDARPTFRPLASATVAERIRTLAENRSWFTLLNIEQDAAYQRLVDEVVDAVADGSGLDRAQLRRRMGFVFASSPGSVTPAHFDIEHSILLQLRGRRRLFFGDFITPRDREEEISRYWSGSFGRLSSMPTERDLVELEPGTGAYIPPYTPHWLSNGEEPSLSLTVTFFERSNEDESRVQVLNERLRRWRLSPRPYGERPVADSLKATAMRGYAAARRQCGRGDGEVAPTPR